MLVPNVLRYVQKANEANCKADAATMLTQLQADYTASQATEQMGATTFPTVFSGITPTADPGADVTAATVTGANKAYSYHITTTTTGTTNTTDITSFVYNNGTYTALWSSGQWTVSRNS